MPTPDEAIRRVVSAQSTPRWFAYIFIPTLKDVAIDIFTRARRVECLRYEVVGGGRILLYAADKPFAVCWMKEATHAASTQDVIAYSEWSQGEQQPIDPLRLRGISFESRTWIRLMSFAMYVGLPAMELWQRFYAFANGCEPRIHVGGTRSFFVSLDRYPLSDRPLADGIDPHVPIPWDWIMVEYAWCETAWRLYQLGDVLSDKQVSHVDGGVLDIDIPSPPIRSSSC